MRGWLRWAASAGESQCAVLDEVAAVELEDAGHGGLPLPGALPGLLVIASSSFTANTCSDEEELASGAGDEHLVRVRVHRGVHVGRKSHERRPPVCRPRAMAPIRAVASTARMPTLPPPSAPRR